MSSTSSTENPHDWEFSKENAAPLECGRSTKSLSKRAFGTSVAEMAAIEDKTKKYERLVRRSEKAVEWLQKQSKRLIEKTTTNNGNKDGVDNRELTEDEAETLRTRLTLEIGFDPTTSDRDNIDYDPMRYWVLYIKHIRESYPSDSQKQFLLMERCARTFMARPFIIPRYQNDVRFIRTCILYADKTSNPSDLFKLMSKIKVGTKVSLFWVAWAWVAEKAQDFPFTEKIFQKAISVGAEPKEFLEERQRQFLRRMSRHWLNASQAQEDGLDDEEDDNIRGRGALNSLSSEGVARNDRVSGATAGRHSQQQQFHNGSSMRDSSRSTLHRIKENKPMVGFNIFQDGDDNGPNDDVLDDDENDPRGGQRLARESERTKENSMRPEMWNERGHGLVNPSTAAAGGVPPPISSDSIVGTARDASFGRPPPIGGIQRSGSAAAFEVFVDEEFNVDDKAESSNESNNGKEADPRSLRQRLDGGTADRLTRDPLRYMRNPSKLESDQIKYDSLPPVAPTSSGDRPPKEDGKRASKPDPKENKTGSRGFDKQLVKPDSMGQECCFMERRLYGRHYKLITSNENFNLLKRESSYQNRSSSNMDTEDSTMNIDESIEEVNMEEDTQEIAIPKPMKSVLKSSLRAKNAAAEMANSEEENTGTIPRRVLFGANTNVVYTNNASVDTSTASSQLNGSFTPVEETINTKLANAEISMMFSSPNANASMAETPGDKSLLASSFKQPMFSTGRNKGTIDDENGYVKPKPSKLEPGSLNFSIYQEDSNESGTAEEKGKGMSFAIHDDDNGKQETGTLDFSYSATASKLDPGGLNFSIYQDDDNKQDERKAQPATSGNSGEDTASLSVLNGILGGGDEKSASLGFGIYSDPEPPSRQQLIPKTEMHTSRPPVRGRRTKKEESVVEDTADLSLINGVMDDLEHCSVTKPPQKSSSSAGFAIFTDENYDEPPTKKPEGFHIFADDEDDDDSPTSNKSNAMGFEIFSDDASDGSVQKKQKVVSANEPCFGDISRIEDEKTSNFTLAPASTQNAIDYESQHKQDMESAMRKCLATAAKSGSQYDIFDYRKKSLPKALLKKSFVGGTKIELSRGEILTILHELGRGVYGVVLLCNDENGQSDALKIQAPIGSLAHEYSLLLSIEDRVEPDPSGFYPFPRSRALYAYSEGGLFSMTAGSDSGMNLIDVVNTYKKMTGNVPEIIAIYFTSRMLKHIEALHQDGKVLVSLSLVLECQVREPHFL